MTRNRVGRNTPARERNTDVRGRSHDPDFFIERALRVETALERLARAEPDTAIQAVYRELAAVYRRANDDASRIWRDVTG